MPGPIFVVREIITTFINIYVGVLIDEPSDVKYIDGCLSCDWETAPRAWWGVQRAAYDEEPIAGVQLNPVGVIVSPRTVHTVS